MKLEIMMIDDDADEIVVSRHFLERRCDDISITAFLDPDDAVAELQRRIDDNESGPQLVTLDINMPRHRGIDLVEIIRPLCNTLNAHVGILTGSVNPADKAAAFDARAGFFAVKPFNADVLSKIGAELGAFTVARDGRRLRIAAAKGNGSSTYNDAFETATH